MVDGSFQKGTSNKWLFSWFPPFSEPIQPAGRFPHGTHGLRPLTSAAELPSARVPSRRNSRWSEKVFGWPQEHGDKATSYHVSHHVFF